MQIRNARFLAGVFLLSLVGCANPPQTRLVLKSPTAILPRHAELTKVSYFAQDEFQCGPASLAMVLNSAGVSVTPEELKPEIYSPDLHGSLQVEMLAAARRHGAIAYQLAPLLNDVLREIAAGTPVIVLQNLALSWYPVWHYAVVIGFDLDRSNIILRSGAENRQMISLKAFEYTWARSNYWAMVALPPGQIPITAGETDYVAAISAAEKIIDAESALLAYQTAAERWPGNLTAQIGMGNAAYRLHDIVKAEKAYRQAAHEHPDSVAAFNNLAQTLSEQARYEEALEAARHAVSLGGPLSQTARETLEDIERRVNGNLNLPDQSGHE